MIARLALVAAVLAALAHPQSTSAEHCGAPGDRAVPIVCARK